MKIRSAGNTRGERRCHTGDAVATGCANTPIVVVLSRTETALSAGGDRVTVGGCATASDPAEAVDWAGLLYTERLQMVVTQ